jgi:5-methylcytosine-specific restriction enzyme subunit McrC
MTTPLLLEEWSPKNIRDLTSEQIGDLLGMKGMKVEACPDGSFNVRSTENIVGYLRRGETSVIVSPSKCNASHVLFMMGYAENPRMFQDGQVEFAEDCNLLEAFVTVFVRSATKAIERGMFRSYTAVEDDLTVVRGRIRMGEQMSRRFRLSPPIALSFDEFTVDNQENRLIRSAIELASKLPIRNPETTRGIQFLRAMFSDVSIVEFDRSWLPQPNWNRLNEHLEYAVSLARRIIQNSSISLEHGDSSSDEFIINMANVFEDFVVTAVREHLKLSRSEMPRANEIHPLLYLDEGQLVRLKPDISRWEGSRCVAIGDVKYKPIADAGVIHADIYQLLAYAVANELPEASLIYAMPKSEQVGLKLLNTHKIVGADARINVFALDLTTSPGEVLRQIAEFSKSFEPRLSEVSVT